jgi:hypothetical protein|tara:strand:+ start:8479 stop:9336 length:858 start_codon:yes stop_codon:yes gene_type:complete
MEQDLNFFLVGTDPGAKNQLKHFKKYLDLKHLNSSFHNLKESDLRFMDKIKPKDIVIIGTSMSMEIENNFYEKIIDKETINYIFIDETYNVKKRLENFRNFWNIRKILYQEFTPKSEIIESIDYDFVGYLTNDIEVPLDKGHFEYIYDKNGPIVLIDEFKEEFHFSDGTKLQNDFLSNSLPPIENLKIRQHPKNFNLGKSNYIRGNASGFLGYSSGFLYTPIINDFNVASLASDKVVSSVLDSLIIPRVSVPFEKLDEMVIKDHFKPVSLKKRKICEEMLSKLEF